MSDLYNRINSLCKQHGTNITALCKKAGVARASLSELNNGRTKTLTLDTVAKIAVALGISIDEINGSEQKEAPTNEGEREIDFDDFTYAMQNESKELTISDKELLLSMAKQLVDARKRMKDGENN